MYACISSTRCRRMSIKTRNTDHLRASIDKTHLVLTTSHTIRHCKTSRFRQGQWTKPRSFGYRNRFHQGGQNSTETTAQQASPAELPPPASSPERRPFDEATKIDVPLYRQTSRPSGGIGRRSGLKIQWGVTPVGVRVPPRLLENKGFLVLRLLRRCVDEPLVLPKVLPALH